MLALLNKEINDFFSSLTGYVVVVIFLLINSLFIWIFPNSFNIIDNGYSTLDSLFVIAPWVFLFLVPAIGMRLFAEEKRNGTFEFLFTRPLTDLQIIAAKYFAGVLLVTVSILPTLLYFLSICFMGEEFANIDVGGTWGSYIGLFFLGAVYMAIGVFASSITDNQIVAFLIGMLLCFLLFIGFEFISNWSALQNINEFVLSLSINFHYQSISRGVVDTRDILYFLTVIFVFIISTRLVLESRKW